MEKLNKLSRTEMKNVMGGLMPADGTLKFAVNVIIIPVIGQVITLQRLQPKGMVTTIAEEAQLATLNGLH